MPDIADLLPSADLAAAPAQLPKNATVEPPGLWQIAKDAASSEWVGSWAYRQFQRGPYSFDPTFTLTPDHIKTLGEGLPPEYWPAFADANSETEAQIIRRQLLDVVDARNRLGAAGWEGRAAQIGASIIDPAAIAATMATAGLGGEVAYGGKAARLAMLARSGLAVGSVNAALTGIRATVDPEISRTQVLAAGAGGFGFGVGSQLTRGLGRGARFLGGGVGQAVPTVAVDAFDAINSDERTARDVLYAGAFSFAMGGILNSLHATTSDEREAAMRLRKSIELDDAVNSGAKLTPKGEAYYAEVSPEAQAEAVRRLTSLTEAADAKPLPASERPAPALSDLDRIDAEIAATLREQDPKVRAEAFARDIITSGWYEPSTQKATLREELVARFKVGAGVADRIIARITPERPPPAEPSGGLRQPALTFGEHAEIDAKLAAVRPAPSEVPEPAIVSNRFGQGVRPSDAAAATEGGKPTGPERMVLGKGLVPDSLKPTTLSQKLELPSMLTPEEAAARGYDYAELGGQTVPFSDAFALARELNRATPGRDYAVVQSGDGFTVGSRAVQLAPKPGKAADVAAYVPPVERPAPTVPPVTREQIVARSEALRTVVPTMDQAEAADIAARQLARERAEQIVEAMRPTPRPADSPGPDFAIGAASQSAMEAGLYEQATQRGEKLPGDLNLSSVTDAKSYNPKVAGVHVRQGMAGLNGQSESPMVRRVTSQLVEDPTAKADNSPSQQSASEWARRSFEVDVTKFLRQHVANFREWAEQAGRSISLLRPFARAKAWREFNELVGKAIRREDGTYSDSPAVNRSAAVVRDGLDKLWMLQNRYQVPGFDQVTPGHNYLTRIWSLTKLNAAVERYGQEAVTNLVAQAIQAKSDTLGPERALVFARGMLQTIKEAKLGSELDRARVLDLPDEEVLRVAIQKANPGITDDQLNDVLYRVRPENDRNLSPRVRRRVSMDETASMGTIDRKTGQAATLAIEDLLENDAAKVYARYARDAYGRSAVAEVIRANRTGENDPLNSYGALLERTRRDAVEAYGVRTRDAQAAADAEIARLEVAFKSVLGHRIGSDSRLAEAGRLMRAVNYLMVGGRVGIHHAQDLASAVGEAGFPTVLRSIPSLGRIITSAISGELSDQTLREIEALWAAGTDHFRGSIGHYLDPDAQIHALGDKADELIRAGARTMNVVNFLAPVAAFNQKAAAIFAEQKWLEIAKSGKSLNAGRLADMGLSAEEGAAIMREMQSHATSAPGLFGRRIVAANVNLWDPEIAAKYIGAVDRWSRSAVVRADIGQSARWMTTDAGQVLTQFRNFNIAAYEKNLIRNGRRADWTTFTNWSMTTLAGALAYIGNEYVNSLGRKDGAEYRREKINAKEVAKAAFQRSSWAAFVPSAVDTVGTSLGFDPIFAGGRFSGLSTNFLSGNPTVNTLTNLYHLPHAVTAPLHPGERLNRGEFSTIRQLIPFQNALGVKNVLDALQEQLPRRREP